jgi:hypothetical protein
LRRDAQVISIRRISLGGGFRYLMDSLAVGDGAPESSSPLARYYSESGTPPGVFLGGGLSDLAGGAGVAAGTQVTEEHLRLMLAACADPISGEPIGGTPRAPAGGVPVALLCSEDLGGPILADAAEAVVVTVAERHSTYGRQNLLAEAHRMLHGVRFASPDDRVAVAERITELAVARSVVLTPPSPHHTPERYRRPAGCSRLVPQSRILYTTTSSSTPKRACSRSPELPADLR